MSTSSPTNVDANQLISRNATHAGSWYTESRKKLNDQLERFLASVDSNSSDALPLGHPLVFPTAGCKGIIAPHAGFSYSGATAAWAYKSIDTSVIERVFILGPSHHAYLDNCALSACDQYETPLGALSVDKSTIKELHETGEFEYMDLETDEQEHSIEMHLPYIKKIFGEKPIKIVPILVGSLDTRSETAYGQLLAPYLTQPSNLFIVSSDFCHWGTRFSYTYYEDRTTEKGVSLSRGNVECKVKLGGREIWESIERVDKEGMERASFSSSSSKVQTLWTHSHSTPTVFNTSAKDSHSVFSAYLRRTKNTICGRHPIGVLLATVAAIQSQKLGMTPPGMEWKLEWLKYDQSSKVRDIRDSSVSYASGVLSLV